MTQLLLTNGTTTVNLIWHNVANRSYMLTRGDWAPTIPALRTSALAQGGPYADVEEEISVNIYGQTAAECLSNLDTLTRLLDQADRWNPKRGENVAAVRLQYMPTGGALLAECVILGRASGDETSGVSLPVTFNRDLGAFLIEHVRVRFWRRGLLLNPTPEATAQTGNAANPTVQGASFASVLNVASPLKLTVNFNFGGTFKDGIATAPAVILTAAATSRLQVYEAESASLGTNVSSVADAAGKARGGSVARYGPGVLVTSLIIDVAAGGFDSTCRRCALWAAVRNNSATTLFTVQASAIWQNVDVTLAQIRPVDTSSLNPRLLYLGTLSTRLQIQKIRLSMTASAASGSLDIDYLCIQAIDDECSAAVALFGAGVGTPASGSLPPGGDPTIIDPRPLEFPTPLLTQTGQVNPINAGGDAFLMSKGQSYAAVWLGTSGTFWRTVDALNNVVDTLWTASRYNAYLIPR